MKQVELKLVFRIPSLFISICILLFLYYVESSNDSILAKTHVKLFHKLSFALTEYNIILKLKSSLESYSKTQKFEVMFYIFEAIEAESFTA